MIPAMALDPTGNLKKPLAFNLITLMSSYIIQNGKIPENTEYAFALLCMHPDMHTTKYGQIPRCPAKQIMHVRGQEGVELYKV